MTQEIILQDADLKAEILTLGATLAGLWRRDHPEALVLGFSDRADFKAVPIYAGAVCGPVANRIAGAQVEIGGQIFRTHANEGSQTTLHSGPDGLHARNWEIETTSTSEAILSCHLTDGACGLPGNRDITAHYTLAERTLTLVLTATSDRDTVMNVVHHPYWAISDAARLRVAATHYLPTDASNIPTGQIAPTAESPFDLRTPVPVPEHLDHCYTLGENQTPAPRHIATLTMPHYRMDLETDAPGLQVYAGGGLPKCSDDKSTGWPIAPNSGLALEPQFWPDAPNNPGFPPIFLAAGESWSLTQLYRFNF